MRYNGWLLAGSTSCKKTVIEREFNRHRNHWRNFVTQAGKSVEAARWRGATTVINAGWKRLYRIRWSESWGQPTHHVALPPVYFAPFPLLRMRTRSLPSIFPRHQNQRRWLALGRGVKAPRTAAAVNMCVLHAQPSSCIPAGVIEGEIDLAPLIHWLISRYWARRAAILLLIPIEKARILLLAMRA